MVMVMVVSTDGDTVDKVLPACELLPEPAKFAAGLARCVNLEKLLLLLLLTFGATYRFVPASCAGGGGRWLRLWLRCCCPWYRCC